ncbi:serine/threonine-protein kinase 32A-like [Hydractinia symbiolongicarpus]|uniref:serine/threonine-protein kinase 32A-like n=2 Tax=Hydractinia symbiolongicarpus TaxID=13093 RepID=UPI00254A1F3F|nr:serine/threonine-protein kinase 32A-like [Hydractinia symbiolongicarpus]XP_057306673.1 serine/threonine-protein kinase 32A-like [Hydractinia symbiolongicarpus]
MGNFSSQKGSASITRDENEPVILHDFHILRSVGRGAFGKVCIIQKKDTKQLYGLKYMAKRAIIERAASRNVLKELEILKLLHHSFLVNLCFSFQDEDDMYIVLDLMLGGDIRFHLNQGHLFSEEEIVLYIFEIGLALGYLRKKRIIHRDIKPDNLLLDSKGHIHLTDFNIATWLPEGKIAVSISGTRPYMAPEVFATGAGKSVGYSFEVDWWSWGVTLCEMMKGRRPFTIHHDMTSEHILKTLSENTVLNLPPPVTSSMSKFMKDLLQPNVKKRVCSVASFKNYAALRSVDISKVEKKLIPSKFKPSNDRLNCDPTHELEEMMIESNPLHKKKRRKRPKTTSSANKIKDPIQQSLENLTNKFTSFRRGSNVDEASLVMSNETIEILSGRKSQQPSPRTIGDSPPSQPPTPRVKTSDIPSVHLNDEPLTPSTNTHTSSSSLNGKITNENRNP